MDEHGVTGTSEPLDLIEMISMLDNDPYTLVGSEHFFGFSGRMKEEMDRDLEYDQVCEGESYSM